MCIPPLSKFRFKRSLAPFSPSKPPFGTYLVAKVVNVVVEMWSQLQELMLLRNMQHVVRRVYASPSLPVSLPAAEKVRRNLPPDHNGFRSFKAAFDPSSGRET
jgi:hypothetical protein